MYQVENLPVRPARTFELLIHALTALALRGLRRILTVRPARTFGATVSLRPLYPARVAEAVPYRGLVAFQLISDTKQANFRAIDSIPCSNFQIAPTGIRPVRLPAFQPGDNRIWVIHVVE